jgi:drug/metabolite transporter (DMT)-like permease
MRRLHADLLLLAAAAIWGLAFVFQKAAMAHIGPFLFITCRAAVAALALAPVAMLERRRGAASMTLADAAPVTIAAGLFFFLGAAFQQAGIVTASVTNTGFLTGLYVVIVPFLAWATTRTAPGLTVWSAVALSFVGTWLLGGGTIGGFGRGDGLVMVSAAFWAAHVIAVGRAARLGRPVAFTAWQFAIVALLAGLAVAVSERVDGAALVQAAPQIAYVGLLSSALTFTLLAVALRYTGPSEAAVLVSMETVFAALAGAVLLGERLQPVGWLGAAMILAATLVVQWRGGRKET